MIDRDEWEGVPDRGIPYCHVGFARNYDISLGSGRPRRCVSDARPQLGPHAPRLRDGCHHGGRTSLHAVASEGTSVGRRNLGPDATYKPLENSFCNAEGADPSFYTPGQIAAFKAPTYAIHLDDAPHVAFRYT